MRYRTRRWNQIPKPTSVSYVGHEYSSMHNLMNIIRLSMNVCTVAKIEVPSSSLYLAAKGKHIAAAKLISHIQKHVSPGSWNSRLFFISFKILMLYTHFLENLKVQKKNHKKQQEKWKWSFIRQKRKSASWISCFLWYALLLFHHGHISQSTGYFLLF